MRSRLIISQVLYLLIDYPGRWFGGWRVSSLGLYSYYLTICLLLSGESPWDTMPLTRHSFRNVASSLVTLLASSTAFCCCRLSCWAPVVCVYLYGKSIIYVGVDDSIRRSMETMLNVPFSLISPLWNLSQSTFTIHMFVAATGFICDLPPHGQPQTLLDPVGDNPQVRSPLIFIWLPVKHSCQNWVPILAKPWTVGLVLHVSLTILVVRVHIKSF